jgi:hypothetical protein
VALGELLWRDWLGGRRERLLKLILSSLMSGIRSDVLWLGLAGGEGWMDLVHAISPRGNKMGYTSCAFCYAMLSNEYKARSKFKTYFNNVFGSVTGLCPGGIKFITARGAPVPKHVKLQLLVPFEVLLHYHITMITCAN